MIRDLKSNEIDVRVAMEGDGWISLLLYKNARVDMDILDETFGPMNWQRHHSRDNANCIVSIWDNEKKQWIDKEDTGTESNTEKEKGLASDSFKRACVNIGIGRELYTSPTIFIKQKDSNGENNYEIQSKNGKTRCKTRFSVHSIEIKNKVITGLVIVNDKDKKVFSYKKIVF
jgi:hypothetical protein